MAQKRKETATEKERIVRMCESGEMSISEAARLKAVDKKTIRRWISRYRSEGANCFVEVDQNRIYNPELKQQAVMAYLSGSKSVQEICEIFKIRDDRQLRDWLKVYNSGKGFRNKMSGGSRMKNTRKTTQEERVEIAKECIESGNNYGLIAKQYNVSYQQARTWTLKYRKLGEAGLEDRRGRRTAQQQPRTEEERLRIRVAQLEHQLYLSKMENDLLKKLEEIERRDALGK